ncbi:alpha/beta hydrolase [Microbacterium tumbae]
MSASAGSARFPGDGIPVRIHRDRRGGAHRERRPAPRPDDAGMPRVVGPLEQAWADAARRPALRRQALERPNPLIEPDPDDPSQSLWTWTVPAADATTVLLWTNPVFPHDDVAKAELTRLADSDLWTICLRLPSALRASYRIGIRTDEETPPWRSAEGRRPVLLAAMAATHEDPRGVDRVTGSRGAVSSVAAGPLAPRDPVRPRAAEGPSGGRVESIDLPHDERAWIYSPVAAPEPTPALILFDGDVWRHELPLLLDAAISAELIPPLHVAMLEAGDADRRWNRLGVPAGQVDTVLDELLPRLQENGNVRRGGEDTIVAGQSLGGIAALWTIALSGGAVGHAIAQSPSLWRFDMAETLLSAAEWRSVDLQAGTREGDMLSDATALAAALRADPRASERAVTLSAFEAGHDWAVWRTNLMRSLVAHPWGGRTPAQAADSSSGAV